MENGIGCVGDKMSITENSASEIEGRGFELEAKSIFEGMLKNVVFIYFHRTASWGPSPTSGGFKNATKNGIFSSNIGLMGITMTGMIPLRPKTCRHAAHSELIS